MQTRVDRLAINAQAVSNARQGVSRAREHARSCDNQRIFEKNVRKSGMNMRSIWRGFIDGAHLAARWRSQRRPGVLQQRVEHDYLIREMRRFLNRKRGAANMRNTDVDKHVHSPVRQP